VLPHDISAKIILQFSGGEVLKIGRIFSALEME